VDNILQNLSDHPMIIIVVIFVGLLIVYFLFKQLLKLALLFFMILLAIGGYFYFKDPGKMSQNMMETLEKARTETVKAVEKSKEAYLMGKAITENGKKLTEGMDNLIIGKEKKTDKTTSQDNKGQK
jgi:glucan phosphoethanolaminetransferase (alkaline phosphatase superfamily)